MKKAILYFENGTSMLIEITNVQVERNETWKEFEERVLKMLVKPHPSKETRIKRIHIFRN